ncbi:hypothetical protein [Roseinatronobacter sp.]|uniref:hypothetical protein n=1 Tax=Roseinatronobacter sp. TaxID=1945755 RepID=UPI003F70984D
MRKGIAGLKEGIEMLAARRLFHVICEQIDRPGQAGGLDRVERGEDPGDGLLARLRIGWQQSRAALAQIE